MKFKNSFYFIFFIFLFSCSKPQKNITIIVGGTGGVYFPLLEELQIFFSKNMKDMKRMQVTEHGSVDNIKLLLTKQS